MKKNVFQSMSVKKEEFGRAFCKKGNVGRKKPKGKDRQI